MFTLYFFFFLSFFFLFVCNVLNSLVSGDSIRTQFWCLSISSLCFFFWGRTRLHSNFYWNQLSSSLDESLKNIDFILVTRFHWRKTEPRIRFWEILHAFIFLYSLTLTFSLTPKKNWPLRCKQIVVEFYFDRLVVCWWFWFKFNFKFLFIQLQRNRKSLIVSDTSQNL